MPDYYLIEISCLLFGLCIGSFLNVCIYRLPEKKSIVHPRSMCPKCKNIISFYDNIPVLSYLWLKGRCRKCGIHIPIRYPFIEMISGFFALCVYLKFGISPETIIYYILIAALIVITFIDIDHQIIPDEISIPGIPIGFAASFLLPLVSIKSSILGIFVGGGTLFTIAWGYQMITGKQGMGGGDIKLLAMIGAFIGLEGVMITIFISSIIGTITGLIIMLRSQKGLKIAVPFGPFLSIGAILSIFLGTELKMWYFSFFI
ncbi:MAG: prepilin peptidase [Desulfobacterales bacterium]|nr:prepilin peptidase [Desulfobacterales bacterium]